MTRHLALIALGLLVCTASAHAQTATRSHPVAVKIEGEVHPSRVYVRFASELYEQPFEAWAARPKDEAATAFVALVQAIGRRDVAAARPLLDLSKTSMTGEQFVAELHAMGSGWNRAVIVARAEVDDQVVFFWRTPRADGPATGAFALRQRSGRYIARLVTGSMPTLALMNDALDHFGRDKSDFAPLDRASTDYGVPMSADGRVLLEFDGEPLDFVPLASPTPNDAVLGLYQQSVVALAAGDWQGFASLYTPASQSKITGWLQNQGRDPRARETAAALIAKGTRVVFVMDLGPVGRMLLVAQGEGSDPTAHPLRRVMVTATPSGPKLTNYFMNYQLGATLHLSPLWPKEAGPLLAVLARAKR